MDSKKRSEKENPAARANPFSQLIMWYTQEIFWKSNRREITVDDIYDPLKSDESERLGDHLEKEWNRELEKRRQLEYALNSEGKKVQPKHAKPSLMRALARMFLWQTLGLALMQFINLLGFYLAQPIFQGWVIDFFGEGEPPTEERRYRALLDATGLVVTKLISVLFMHHSYRYSWLMGMRARAACSTMIYRKTLRLNKSVLQSTAAGQVVNLMSNDVSRFDYLFQFINYAWIVPFQSGLILYIMWDSIGVMLLLGLGILLVIAIPLQSIVIYASRILRAKIAVLTDKRVQLMSELVSGIQVVKMYAWEKPFEKIVNKTRLDEMRKVSATQYVRSIFVSSMVYTERTTVFAILVLFVLMGNQLTAEISFVLSMYFNILQLSIIYMMPNGFIAIGEASVSIKRIEDFLLLDEIVTSNAARSEVSKKSTSNGIKSSDHKGDEIKTADEQRSSMPVEITFERVSANWTSGQLPPTLNEVSFVVEPGSLCALAGVVGSGKSAVLSLVLRELPLGAGSVRLRGRPQEGPEGPSRQFGYHSDDPALRISYASQDAWLFAGTVRENILFGQPFDPVRYNEVTQVCALRHDFEQLARGDQTVVGERGTSLSGGQRARVNLARAVYRRADVYLLDDPLSAVDPRIARHLFDKCVRGYLRGTTRILVTHQLQFLRKVDSVVFLDRGSVKYSGSYENISKLNPQGMDLLGKLASEDQEAKKMRKESVRSDKEADSRSLVSDVSSVNSLDLSANEEEQPVDDSSVTNEESEVKETYTNYQLFKTYFRAGASWCVLGFYAVVVVLAQVATSGTDWWLSYWTNLEDLRTKAENGTMGGRKIAEMEPAVDGGFRLNEYFWETDENGLMSTKVAISIYAVILVFCSVLCLLRNYLIIRICMKSSRCLHKVMFSNLLHTVMSFFNKNSSGRILNRFSKDTGAMDELLSKNFAETVQIFSILIGIFFVVIIVSYWMIIPVAIIIVLFWYAKNFYLKTAQKIKRLETVTKSPVFSHVNATLAGLATIRSSGHKTADRLIKEFDRYQNDHTGTSSLMIVTATTFGLFLDISLVVFNAVLAYGFVLMNNGKNLPSSSVGLALAQATIMTGMVQHGFRLFIEVMAQLTSVERIIEYTHLPKEHPLTSPTPLPEKWPSKGRVTFRRVSMRYGEDQPYVLKNLNVVLEAGWKVGIVGRTGAGKSSIIAALFRLIGEHLEGEIKIDGIDTGHVGLHDLRTRISIIPQEPVLFTQTLRYNLDPFGQYPDSALWDALREVELTELQLDQLVAERGGNLSVGQRQLICLARAIVRQNSLLVLDEATANIDTHTDAIIQNTIRKRFANCTVLTVAHRLNTIIDSDRIIVMDNGTIVEFGCPHELLNKEADGYFLQMVKQTGKTMAKKLESLAEKACVQNRQNRSLEISEDSTDSLQTAEIESEESYDSRL